MPSFNSFCFACSSELWKFAKMDVLFFCVTEDENLVFRGNSFATKAMDSYMKMIGESVSRQWFIKVKLTLEFSVYFRIPENWQK